jgi:hypothetical protein
MKLSECTPRQKKAYTNIYHAANWLIGGLENTILDYAPEDEERINAEALLKDHDALVQELYYRATTEIYGDGYCCFDPRATQKYLREINFCGTEWLMARCEARVKKCGY